jgi:hypothetical protein
MRLLALQLCFQLIPPILQSRQLGFAELDGAFDGLDFLVLAAAADDRNGVVFGDFIDARPGAVEVGLMGGDGRIQLADFRFDGGSVARRRGGLGGLGGLGGRRRFGPLRLGLPWHGLCRKYSVSPTPRLDS